MNEKLDLVVKRPYKEDDKTLCFETTSIWKVVILNICTFGAYSIILYYNYWKTLNNNFGHKVSPFFRAIFAPFTNFALFPILGNYLAAFKQKLFFSPIFLAIIYFICRLQLHNAIKDDTDLGTAIIILLISVLLAIIGLLILVYWQYNINKINKEYFPNAKNNKWSAVNTVWSILGVILGSLGILMMTLLLALSK